MSSKIEIEKICKCCGELFIAKKTSTDCCSHKCSSRLYKARKRGALIRVEKEKTDQQIYASKVDKLKDKSMLTITEVSRLLGAARSTIYRYIENGELPVFRLGCKTFISKDDLFSRFKVKSLEDVKPFSSPSPISYVYTIDEIMEKYKIRKAWIYKIVAENRIPKTYKRGRCYYSKPDIDKHLAHRNIPQEITEWYSVDEAMKKFKVSRDSLYHHVKHNNVPKVKAGRKIKISKTHLDKIFTNPIII